MSADTREVGAEGGAGCNCINLTNEALKEHNERLVVAFLFNRETGRRRTVVRISTDLIEKKRGQRPRFVIPEFCPFCGKPYEQDAARGPDRDPEQAGGEAS